MSALLRCHARAAPRPCPGRHLALSGQVAARAEAKAADASNLEFPESAEQAVEQAVTALTASFQPPKKAKKKGRALWAGERRLAVEIPVQDQSPAAQLDLVKTLVATLPTAAGLPTVVFADQAAAVHARAQDAPYLVFSIDEAAAPPESGDKELTGALLIFGASYDQAAACRVIVEERWRGKALVVVNAGWLRDTPPPGSESLAASLDAVYYFLPVSFGGILGGGQEAFLFRWIQSAAGRQWSFVLQGKGGLERIGRMPMKPSNEDMETMVYNASAAKSPLSKGARMFGSLSKALRGGGKEKEKQ